MHNMNMNMTMGRMRYRMAPAIMRAIGSYLGDIGRSMSRRRDIEHLQALPDHMLKDIGLHRSQIVSAVHHGVPRRGGRA